MSTVWIGATQNTEGLGRGQTQRRISQLDVVENVGELEQQGGPNAFFPTEVLGDGSVEVPSTHTADGSGRTAIGIDTEDAIAEFRQDLRRILEHIDAAVSGGARGGSRCNDLVVVR